MDHIKEKKEEILKIFNNLLIFEALDEDVITKIASELKQNVSHVRLYFPNGVEELVEDHLTNSRKEFFRQLKIADFQNLKIREKISQIILHKFRFMAKNKGVNRKLISYLTNPLHSGILARAMWDFADESWHLAGDRSVDYNYYTKRILFIYVYITSLLALLDEDFVVGKNIEEFVDRRIAEVLELGKVKFSKMEILKFVYRIPILRVIFSEGFFAKR